MQKTKADEYGTESRPPEYANKYKQLFTHMLNGYAIHEIICDNQGKPIDYRFLAVNPAFERMTGLKAENIVGHTVLEILPNTEPIWIERYGKVALTGETIHFKDFSKELNIHFEVEAFRTQPNQFACSFVDISASKDAYNALKESERELSTLMNNLPGMAYRCSFTPEWNFYKCTGSFDLTGYISEVFISQKVNYNDLIMPEDEEYVWNNVKKCIEQKKPYILEYRIRTASGQIKWVWEKGRAVFAKDGKPKFLEGFILDITERKHIEEALKENELIFKHFLKNSPIYIFFKDKDIKSLRLSKNFEEMLGIPIDQLLGKTMDELFPSELAKKMIEDDKKILNEGKVVTVNEEFNGKQYATTKFPIFIDGEPQYLAGFTIDITEQKQAEKALAAQKERLSVTLSSIGDGVISTDAKGNIVMLNKISETLTGWSTAEAIGRPLTEVFNIINERTRKKCINPFEKVLEIKEVVELETHTCLVAKDGSTTSIADCAAPIHDNDNRIIGVVIVFRDMTEKNKLDESVQRSQKLESLGILAGGIAHDFNNLLGGIFGFIEVAMQETTQVNVTNFLSESLSNIERARALTHQLLTFSKGGDPIKTREELFPFVQKTIEFALSGSAISCQFQIQNDLWSCEFDKNQIGQVLDNLTINAMQSMPNGGSIEVSAENHTLGDNEYHSLPSGNYIKLSIKDHGVGIPQEFISKIFDPYYSTKSSGRGLGLSTCYSIIHRHSGYIYAESSLGEGSTFHIFLPGTCIHKIAAKPKRAASHKGSGTFLVMDDEEAIRSIMQNLLELFGYTVVTKDNGQDAIDFCREETAANRKVAGMVFDLTIPGGIGGKDAIKEIRLICPDTPAFVASGYAADPIMANPTSYGFTASICKPFMKQDLSEMLEKHMHTDV